MSQAYPLLWPVGHLRRDAARRMRSRFGKWNAKPTVASSVDELLHEMRLFGATRVVISSNVVLRNDGLPRSGQAEPKDPGAAVYFRKADQDLVIACDTFDKVGCNLKALARTVNAWRQMERDGCGDMLQRTYVSFKALPQNAAPSDWRTVLGVPAGCSWQTVVFAWRSLCKRWHPDVPGGDRHRFDAVQEAYQQAQKEFGADA